MVYFNKRGADPGFNLVLAMVLSLLLISLVVGLIVVVKGEFLNKEDLQQTGCWLTNTVKCKGGALSGISSLCIYETIDDVGQERLAGLLRDTSWMYQHGTCDFGNIADEIFPAYAITMGEDVHLKDFFPYLASTNRGRETDIENSDLAYIEEFTKGDTICFDKTDEESSLADSYLEKGETYYILFYDDQVPHGDGDLILISGTPEFSAGTWQAEWYEYLIPVKGSYEFGRHVRDQIFDPKYGACVAYGQAPGVSI